MEIHELEYKKVHMEYVHTNIKLLVMFGNALHYTL